MTLETSVPALVSFAVLILVFLVLLWLHFSKRGQQATDDAFDKAGQYGDSADEAIGGFVQRVEDELPAVVEAVKAKVKK